MQLPVSRSLIIEYKGNLEHTDGHVLENERSVKGYSRYKYYSGYSGINELPPASEWLTSLPASIRSCLM